MITRGIFLYAIVLFTLGHTVAYADCVPQGEPGHNNCVAGTYWDLSFEVCKDCPDSHYCPGNGIAYCCPEPFTQSDEGAASIAGCYAELQCGSENVYIYCDSFDDDNNCELDTENSGYSVQGYFDPNID